MEQRRLAVVTGASSGIGAATARQLAAEGFEVICAARRTDRIEALAAEIDGRAIGCDVTSPDDVTRLAEVVGDRLAVLVNNAGGALRLEPVATADLRAWQTMFDVNVLGTARVTQALLPALIAEQGVIVFVTSTAADAAYEGGGGYNAA
ncbi:MAG: SDR family NAD(P)-dependent oxidoreductase, partial [Propionibacteriaceae bacterium]|nr:SDR family NAD(P)-dependent oxidoreductase [Propionibacteriaceae bacterium]